MLAVCPHSVYADWYKQDRAAMGTRITVEIWSENAKQAQQCTAAVMGEMHRIDALMSPFKKDSGLSLLNREAYQRAIRPGEELYTLIARAQHFSKISAGAFDITFASVGYQYDFRKHLRPSDKDLRKHLGAVDYHHIILDPKQRSVRYSQPGVRIDLGGIAKGYAVDNSIKILRACGIHDGLVTAGGDSRIMGDKHGRPWMMGVRNPRDKHGVAVVLPLSNIAISTSGDYERYFMEGGKRYHHILSPRTGKPVSQTRSATVIGPDATNTDALSTTLFVLGVKKGLALVESMPDYDAVIIDANGKMHYSAGLMAPKSVAKTTNQGLH